MIVLHRVTIWVYLVIRSLASSLHGTPLRILDIKAHRPRKMVVERVLLPRLHHDVVHYHELPWAVSNFDMLP